MLEIGSVIDERYKVLNIIGRGGMSIVYLAMNEKVNKQWAVKEVIKNDYKDFEVDKKEIEMMKKLKHRNLPSIVDVIEKENSLLIVMDYIEGRSLDVILAEQGAQPEKIVIDWAKQLCEALGYLHGQTPPIIYRDMKPANVMLKPDGTLMLIDFGAAREYNPQNIKDTISLGTRGYAAPEQYREDGQSDVRTDIYCLGVMLFQLLTGENPHGLRPIRDLKQELSAGLESIVLKCTQIKKEDRYQSIPELLYALEHYWQYDEKYRKKQKKKLLSFALPVILALLFAMGTLVFSMLEDNTRKSHYETYIQNAEKAITKEIELENYRKAICLNPERAEAYMGLLKNGYLDDHILTAKESEQLRHILIEYGNGRQTNEKVFQENTEKYDEFAYEAGIAYFYQYEDRTNKKNAKSYFETAAASNFLDSGKKERAARLFLIADYYSSIGMIDEAGDAFVTYLDYWNDMLRLSAGNLVKEDNARTALVMYGELVSQVVSRAGNFMSAGVRKQDVLAKLDDIREHLKTDFSEISQIMKANLTEEIDMLLAEIELAERVVKSTYGQQLQEEL